MSVACWVGGEMRSRSGNDDLTCNRLRHCAVEELTKCLPGTDSKLITKSRS